MSTIGFFPQPFPVQTPKGEGYAVYVVATGMHENDCWCVELDTGEILHFSTNQLRSVGNGTYDMPRPPAPEAPGAADLEADHAGNPRETLRKWSAVRAGGALPDVLREHGMPEGADAVGWIATMLDNGKCHASYTKLLHDIAGQHGYSGKGSIWDWLKEKLKEAGHGRAPVKAGGPAEVVTPPGAVAGCSCCGEKGGYHKGHCGEDIALAQRGGRYPSR